MAIDRIVRGLKRDYYWLNSAYNIFKTCNSANKNSYEKALSSLEEARKNLTKYLGLDDKYEYEIDIATYPVQLLCESFRNMIDFHFKKITESEFVTRAYQLRDAYRDYCSKYPLNKHLQLEFNI